MQKQITVIYPATIDWFLLYQRPQQLLTSFSKIPGVRSIFVTSEAYRKLGSPVLALTDDLYIVKPGYDYNHLVKGRKVFWFSCPMHYSLVSQQNADLTVFDALDSPTDEFSCWAKDIPHAERAADLISCTAQVLYDHHIKSGKPVFMCPNGADYEHFRTALNKLPRPSDLPKLEPGEKLIGFYGAMASWVDYELILKIASKYKVVLIGNNQYYYNNVIHPNIYSLDHKDYKLLPNYLSHFDAAMVPFKLTEMIKGCDPIKFYEYLSGGKPVLATEMVELKKYEDVTYFINHDNVLEVVEKALKEDSSKKKYDRLTVARENSWDARAKVAMDMIRKHLN